MENVNNQGRKFEKMCSWNFELL